MKKTGIIISAPKTAASCKRRQIVAAASCKRRPIVGDPKLYLSFSYFPQRGSLSKKFWLRLINNNNTKSHLYDYISHYHAGINIKTKHRNRLEHPEHDFRCWVKNIEPRRDVVSFAKMQIHPSHQTFFIIGFYEHCIFLLLDSVWSFILSNIITFSLLQSNSVLITTVAVFFQFLNVFYFALFMLLTYIVSTFLLCLFSLRWSLTCVEFG